MAVYTLTELLTSKTQAQYVTDFKTEATTNALPVSSWKISSIPYMLMSAFSKIAASFDLARIEIAKGGLLELATGAWLDLLTFNVYQEYRIEADFTTGVFVLDDAGNAGPFTIAVGQLWVQNSSGLLYNNTSAGTLTLGGTLELNFKAQKTGSVYNIANDSVLQLVTALAGVLVTNPDQGAGSWITDLGREAETDAELRARCTNKWPASGLGMTEGAWVYHTLKASADVAKVDIITNPGSVPGLTRVVIAGPTGTVAGSVVTTVNTYLQPLKTITTTVEVVAATGQTIAIVGTVYTQAGYVASVTTQAAIVIAAYAETLSIDPKVYLSKIIGELQDITGVEYVILTSPSVDVTTVTGSKVVSFDITALAIEEAV